MGWNEQVYLTALLAGLILLIQHYFPWLLLLGKDLPNIARYVLGVLGFVVPLSLLYSGAFGSPSTDHLDYMIALWVVVLASGAAVVGAYALDWLMRRITMAGELEELLELKERDDE